VAYLVTLSVGHVAAARAQSIDGRFRLGFEGGLVEHQSETASVELPNSFGSPTTFELTEKTTSIGPSSLPFGVIAGYGLSEQLVLGGRLDLSHRNITREGQGQGSASLDLLGFGFTTMLDFVPGEGALRPFVGPSVGYALETQNGSDVSHHVFKFGAQAGLHAFVTPGFSVDPSVFFVYHIGGESSQTLEADVNGFSIGLRLALSGWIGGGSEANREPPPEPMPYAPPPYSPPPEPQYQPGYPPPNPSYPNPSYPPPQPAYPPQGPAYQAPPQAPAPQAPAPQAPAPQAPAPQAPPPQGPPSQPPQRHAPPSQAFPSQ
jgi:hypothetical protein